MIRLVILKSLLLILLYLPVGYAQEYKAIPGQPTPDLDYFTADPSPSHKQYLFLVTKHHTDKILVWIREGKMNAAIYDVKYTLDRFPNHPKGLELAGLVAQLSKTPSLAIYYYERALRLFPQYALTHAQYGAYWVGTGHMDVGIAELKKAIEMDPNLTVAYVWLASAYYKNGNPDLARQAAENARELGYKGKIPGEISEQ